LQAIDLIRIIKFVKVIDIIYQDMLAENNQLLSMYPTTHIFLSFNLHDVSDDVV